MHSFNTAKILTWFLFFYLSFSFFFTLQSHALYPHSSNHTHTILSTTPTRTAPSLTSYLFRHSTLPYLTRSHFCIFLAGQSPGQPMWNQSANTNPNPYGMPQMPSFAPSTAYSPPAVADPLTTYASQVPCLLKKTLSPILIIFITSLRCMTFPLRLLFMPLKCFAEKTKFTYFSFFFLSVIFRRTVFVNHSLFSFFHSPFIFSIFLIFHATVAAATRHGVY